MNGAVKCGETQPLTVSASRFSEGRDEPKVYVDIHNPRVENVTEWHWGEKQYFTIDLGWRITIFVDDIEELMNQLREAYENREVKEVEIE